MTPHADTAEQVLTALNSSPTGLNPAVARQRLLDHGANQLPSANRRPAWHRFLLQFHNPLIYVLLAAAGITFWLKDYIDAAVILAVIVINAIIGFLQESKAERALEAVRSMLASRAMVLRQGERLEIAAEDLVPGDVVLLESGGRVPADLRLFHSRNLHINESALTGESLPEEKSIEPVPVETVIADRSCLAFSGTVVTSGQGRGVVFATGSHTEIGRIGTLVSGVETLTTPLTRRLDQFSRQITVLILGVCGLAFAYGHFIGQMPLLEVFLTMVGLAVSAIPEGLPAIVTITLAIGTNVLARHHAIVRRLPAVEGLGSVSVICTDKTGTLTKNEMTAVRLLLPTGTIEVSGTGYSPEGAFHQDGQTLSPEQDPALQRLLRCALLCNDARLYQDSSATWVVAGDPTEGALLSLAQKAGMNSSEALATTPRLDEIPFESEHRFMATLHHDHQGQAFILLKGAPERVLTLCQQDSSGAAIDLKAWHQRMALAAGAGQRVLALAEVVLPRCIISLNRDDISPQFTLLGLIGMIDPPRPEAISAIAQCQQAGIRVVMITGDHDVTAGAIGQALGLNSGNVLSGDLIEQLNDEDLARAIAQTDVVARASPEHKLRLVSALQAGGQLVAMTGDGVNDAPALKAADIGVAMGQRGTDAAREAADLILSDDNFATIARAVQEGRTVFDNIKKSLLFILPTNGGAAGVILLAILAGLTLPVSPSQILWINLVTTITLALALAFEPTEAGVMSRPPRPPQQALVTPLLLARVAFVSILMTAACFAVYQWELLHGHSLESARTAVVNMLVFGELVYLFQARQFTASGLQRQVVYGNPVAFWAAVTLAGLQGLFTYAPPMQTLFASRPLGLDSWGLIVGLALLQYLLVEGEKAYLRHRGLQSL